MPRIPTLTRRGLFRGLGTATIAIGCRTQTDSTTPGDGSGDASEIGPDAHEVSFTLNGRRTRLEAEPRVTLLDALRHDLGTTGPKVVCDRGACSACTVHVDGVPRNACMMLVHDVAGREVTTVEGLAAAGRLTVLQQAFVDHDAMQCGFCTSGMLMSASALLDRHQQSGTEMTAGNVEEALSGHLCRCGTYPHVVAAVLSASKQPKAASKKKAPAAGKASPNSAVKETANDG